MKIVLSIQYGKSVLKGIDGMRISINRIRRTMAAKSLLLLVQCVGFVKEFNPSVNVVSKYLTVYSKITKFNG